MFRIPRLDQVSCIFIPHLWEFAASRSCYYGDGDSSTGEGDGDMDPSSC